MTTSSGNQNCNEHRKGIFPLSNLPLQWSFVTRSKLFVNTFWIFLQQWPELFGIRPWPDRAMDLLRDGLVRAIGTPFRSRQQTLPGFGLQHGQELFGLHVDRPAIVTLRDCRFSQANCLHSRNWGKLYVTGCTIECRGQTSLIISPTSVNRPRLSEPFAKSARALASRVKLYVPNLQWKMVQSGTWNPLEQLSMICHVTRDRVTSHKGLFYFPPIILRADSVKNR